MGPHWNPKASEISVVIHGQGMVQIICPTNAAGQFMKDIKCQNSLYQVKEGDVFLVPKYHPMTQISFNNDSFVFMGFSTNARNNYPQFLAGERSVLKEIDSKILKATFGAPNSTVVEELLSSQHDAIILGCTSCGEDLMGKAEEERQRAEKERRREEKRREEEERRKEERRREEEEETRRREEEEARRREEEKEARRREEEARRREEEEARRREEERARREQEEEEEARRREEEEVRKREEQAQREEEEEEAKGREEEEARRREEEQARREEEEEEEARRREEGEQWVRKKLKGWK